MRLTVLGIGVLLLVGMAGTAVRAAEADKVKVRLDWVIRGGHAMFFVAKEKGYFKNEHIDIELIHKGNGSVNTMTLVGKNEYDFGFGDLPTLVVAKSKGVPVASLVVVNQRSPMALVALKGTGLKTPKDAEGKVAGVHPSGSTFIFYQALMAANGVDRKKVTEATVPVPYESFLLTRKVQIITGYIDAEIPELEAKAGGPGSLEIVIGADYGYDLLGSGMLTSEKMIKEKPDLVRRFTRAYLRAFQDVLNNPQEAVEILARHNPEVAEKRDVMLKQLDADIKYTFTSDDTKANGLGWNPQKKWQATHDTLLKLNVIEKAVPTINSLYSNDFLK
jgi:NitT/TauT family transport system substrate-binding protein